MRLRREEWALVGASTAIGAVWGVVMVLTVEPDPLSWIPTWMLAPLNGALWAWWGGLSGLLAAVVRTLTRHRRTMLSLAVSTAAAMVGVCLALLAVGGTVVALVATTAGFGALVFVLMLLQGSFRRAPRGADSVEDASRPADSGQPGRSVSKL